MFSYKLISDVSHIKIPSLKIPQSESAVSKVPSPHEQEDGIILAVSTIVYLNVTWRCMY